MLGTGVRHRRFFIYFLVMMLVVGTLPLSFAETDPVPVYYEGNDEGNVTLPSYLFTDSTFSLKISSGIDEDQVITSGAITITGTSDGGKTLDWESDGQPISHVFVKAGNGGYLYTYDPAVYSGSVYTPKNKGGQQANLSHITFFYVPPKPTYGNLTITKDVIGDDLPEGTTEFTIEVEGPDGFFESFTLVDGQTVTFNNILTGDYTITEKNLPDYFTMNSITDDGFVEVVENDTTDVIVTNEYEEPLGSITLYKVVEDQQGIDLGDVEMSFTINVASEALGYDKDFVVPADGSKTASDLSFGTYTISEPNVPNGYAFKSIDPSVVVIDEDGESVDVTITNTKNEDEPTLGSLSIAKFIVTQFEESVENDDTVFTVRLTGPGESEEFVDVPVTQEEPSLVNGLDPGVYTLEEINVPDGYEFAYMTEEVTIVAGKTAEASVTNAISPPVPKADLTITKTLDDDDVPTDIDQTFTFKITHPNESVTFETIDGAGTTTIKGLALGTYLIEEVEAEMPANFTLVSTNNLSVTFDEENLSDSVGFTNSYDAPEEPDPKADLTITKTLEGDDVPEGADQEFTFKITHPDESITFETIDGAGMIEMEDLPLGTYLIEEVEDLIPANFTLTTDNNLSIIFDEQKLDGSVRFTNSYDAQLGELIVQKVLSGDTPPDAIHEFDFTVVGEDVLESFSITGNGSKTLSGLAPGLYTVTETGMPTIFEFESIVSGEEIVTEVQSLNVSVVDDGTTTVVVTNSYDEPFVPTPQGSLTIEKDLTGDTAPSANFTFSIEGEEYSSTRSITGEGDVTISGLAPGSYTVEEINVPTAFDFVSIASGDTTVTNSQSIVVTVADDQETTVVVTNDYDAPDQDEPEDDDDDDEDEPRGPVTRVDLTTDEVEIEEPVPQAPALPKRPKVINPPDEEIILDEPIPEAPAALPQTGELPPALFYGIGSLLSLMGVTLKRKDR